MYNRYFTFPIKVGRLNSFRHGGITFIPPKCRPIQHGGTKNNPPLNVFYSNTINGYYFPCTINIHMVTNIKLI